MIRRWWRDWWLGVVLVLVVVGVAGLLWWHLPTCDAPWIVGAGSTPVVICR